MTRVLSVGDAAHRVADALGDRAVLIAYYFPPDPAVGALRAAKVARMLREAGYRVDVITARLPGETGIRTTDDPGLVVHPVTLLPMPRELFTWLKAHFRAAGGSRGGATPAVTHQWTAPTRVAGWRRFLFSLLWLPDDRQGFIFPAWRKARACVRAGARLVYSTGPPYSPHLAGLAVRMFGGVRWVMELRDPWSDNDQKPWWVRTRLTDAVDAGLERLCLRRADLVVAVSEGIERRLAGRMGSRSKGRLLVIRNGIENLASSILPASRDLIRIVYAGTFYYSRDPRPFLRGLAATCRKHSLGPDRVQVDFVGACRSIGPVSVEREIETLGLAGIVHIKDWLPHADIKTLVEEADVLLLLAQQQPDQVPNKLYEYLGTRRPILAFADADGETARMLRRAGGHQVLTDDDEVAVQRALEGLLTSSPDSRPSRPDEAVLREWTTAVQMKRLLAAVRG